MNSRTVSDAKNHEYDLLNEIAQDSMVTQANLSDRLGIAVGSVNWYIKRLVSRGWIKVSHLDRTRLKYDLTSEGMKVFTQRALLYAKGSLKVYSDYREKAKTLIYELQKDGIYEIHLDGDDEVMDILRLTCIEAGLQISNTPNGCTIKVDGMEYKKILIGKRNE
ncbi:MAG: winged helix-turn-helix transcriptional regulator [Anaerolineales bacterium]